MKNVQRILVPTDFSEASSRAFSYALWFADHIDASIDLLHVVFPGTDVMDFPAMAAQVANIQIETAKNIMQSFTNEALARLESTVGMTHTPQIRSHVEVGAPSSFIVAFAEDMNADLIAIGTRGEHNRLETAFGTVTTSVANRSPVPVLVIPSEIPGTRIDHIAYATGLQDSDPLHIWEVSELLSPFNAQYKVVHVKTANEGETEVDMTDLEEFFKDKPLRANMSFYSVHNDDVEVGLEDFVASENVDLLVMHSPKRNLFERIGHRSVTRKMVLFNHLPILVLK